MRDPLVRAQLADLLAQEGFEYELFNHESALMRVMRHRGGIDLVLLDIGHEPAVQDSVLSWLACRSGDTVPVILASAHWNPQRVAMALEAGADDCVSRPCERVELAARMRAVLRRSGLSRAGRARIEVEGFVLDKEMGVLFDRGKPVELTPREFALAWLFFSNMGQRLARDAIGLAIWGLERDIANRTIEQHVYKLRKKIDLCAARGVMIRTTYGEGYRLEVCEGRLPKTGLTSANRLSSLDAQRNAPLA
jgi:DNA-binding response OmpR family regulator